MIAYLLPAGQAHAQAGDLDEAFGGGVVTSDFSGGNEVAWDVVVQPDGKIIAVGGDNYDLETDTWGGFALARYNIDGTLDDTFGVGGQVITQFPEGNEVAWSVALQADGKIVVAGHTDVDFAVARYNTDGSLDDAFGDAGLVSTDFAGEFDEGHAVALDADGRIVVAGRASGDFGLARYNPDGSLDDAFGINGLVMSNFGGGNAVWDVVTQTDGKIIVAGEVVSDFALVRYNSDGSPDGTFGENGLRITDFAGDHDESRSVVLQDDGKIVAAGNTGPDFGLARYNVDGTLDDTFGTAGLVTTDFGDQFDEGWSVDIQSDGKIVMTGGGFGPASTQSDLLLARYTSAGVLDVTFGNGGIIVTDIAGNADSGFSVATETDGDIVVAGFTGTISEGTADFAVARYVGTATPPPADSLTVTHTDDSGANSLREAILFANVNEGFDTITFDIPNGAPHTITLNSALPSITEAVMIDGVSQPGAACGNVISEMSLAVTLDGSALSADENGLRFGPGSDGSTLRGLELTGFPGDGVVVDSSDGATVQCNIITGIDDQGPNLNRGISVEFSNGTVIGGSDPGEGNLISGNAGAGIQLLGSSLTQIMGNWIGTDATGNVALPNIIGVHISVASENIVGGTAAGEGNVISGNETDGVLITDGASQENLIQGNLIGRAADGVTPLGNGTGVRFDFGGGNDDVFSAPINNTVGGTAPGAGNVISYNELAGVAVVAGSGNAILSNSIHSNGLLGIDLGSDDVTPNDKGDGDFGANNQQNFPILDVPEDGDGVVSISGSLDSTPGATFRIEFFASFSCDSSGHGEGRTFLGSTQVTTDGGGQAFFEESFGTEGDVGSVVTATATDVDNNTSEFAECPLPDISVPDGYIADVIADGFEQPQGLADDGNGNVIVAASGSGEIYRLSPSGERFLIANGFSRPIDLARQGNTLYVSDLDYNGIFEVSLLFDGVFTVNSGNPLVSGLDGPTHLEFGPDGFLYASVVRGTDNDRVVRIDLETATATNVITFASDTNPQGMDFLGDYLYLANQFPGTITRTIPNGPVEGSTLPSILSGLSSPGGLAFWLGDRMFVATSHVVARALPGVNAFEPFLTGLSGDDFNNVFVAENNVMYVTDRGAGRIIRVAVPQQQIVPGGHFTYMISQGAAPTITDGSDFTAINNAFNRWQNIATSTISFTNGGTTPISTAGFDGANVITFTDTDFLFSTQTLAVTAKTLVLQDDGVTADVVDVDIVVNPAFVHHPQHPITTTGSDKHFDMEAVLAHEIGHSIGLFHSPIPPATMFFAIPKGVAFRTLEADDVAHASSQYPTPEFLVDPGAIEGQVIDGNSGEPVAGAFVIAIKEDAPEEAVAAYSALDGSYLIRGLLDGDHKVIMGPLDGDVWGYNMRPMNVSLFHHLTTTNVFFPVEWHNGANESADPGVDSPSDFELVPVSSTTTDINFITNQDLTPPVVDAFSPLDGATNVPATAGVAFTFSEPIDTSSVRMAFSLTGPSNADVPGVFTYLNGDQTAIFAPLQTLTPGASYSFSLDPAVEDKSGNVMTSGVSATFSIDDSIPTVTLISPEPDSIEVFVTTDVTMVFSEPIDPTTMDVRTSPGDPSSFALTDESGNHVAGLLTFSVGNSVATFSPATPLAEAQTYTVDINDPMTTELLSDASGNPLSAFTSSFTTVESAQPQVFYVGPNPEGVTGITVETPILVDITEPIDKSTISTSSVRLDSVGSAGPVDGTFEFLNSDSRIIFRPNENLTADMVYTVTVTTDVEDKTGEPLLTTFTRSFTTAADTGPVIAAVSPPSGIVGTTVTISGAGFDPDPSLNTVSFNGTTATVSSSTLSKIVTTVPAGATTGPLTVTVDSETSNSFSFGIVDPVDLEDAAVWRVTSNTSPNDADITPDGGTAYTVNRSTNSVSALDIASASFVGEPIAVGDTPLRIDITPDGNRAYVTNFGSHTVTMINLADRSTVHIPTGFHPVGVAVSPDGANVYISEFTSESITVLDGNPTSGAFNNATARISSGTANTEIKLTPDGVLALVGGEMGVTIIDLDPTSATFNSAVARVSSNTSTTDIAISPDGGIAVAVTRDGGLIVIAIDSSNPTASSVVARVSSSADASSVEFSPDGVTFFATNFTDGTITAYEVSEIAPGDITAKSGGGDDKSVLALEVTPIATIMIDECAQNMAINPTTQTIVTANSCEGVDEGSISIVRFNVSPGDRIDALMDRIHDLVESGELEMGFAEVLLADLDQAFKKQEKNKRQDAIKKLQDFIKHVEQFVASGFLDADIGQELIVSAQIAISDLRNRASKGGPDEEVELPTEFALRPNYPNPFNPSTTIEYDIPGGLDGPVRVRLEVYNVLGQRVALLVNEEQPAGRHKAVWDGRTAFGAEAASGVYLFRIEMGSYQNVKKMTLVR